MRCSILFISIFFIASCSLISKKNRTQLTVEHLPIILKNSEKKCSNPKIGNELTLRVSLYNSEKTKFKDTLIVKFLGNQENDDYWNTVLDILNPCDSALIDPKLISNQNDIAFASVKMLGFNSIKNKDSFFFNLLHQNSGLNITIHPDTLFQNLEYGDTITFTKYELNENGYWKIYNNETFIYNPTLQDYWIKKWFLQGFPNVLLIDKAPKTKSKFIYAIQKISVQKAIPVSNNIHPEQIDWITIEDGLSFKKIFDAQTIIPHKNTWMQIQFQIFNSNEKAVLNSAETTIFYFNDELVPKAWIKCLYNAKINDHFYIQADYPWGYGKNGLYPLIMPKEKVFFDIKVIDVPQD
jgi:hypothetical protein